ncbi:MAG TPA: hypothetical protein VFE33_12525 [Thermoanaerobaculia bacterium]|nr:hypothetical protein [Thermoanaerobaculia bacterium]
MNWKLIFTLLGVVAVISVTLAALLFAAVHRRLRRLRVPPGADFFTTVRAVPLALVVGLDLLDLGLDMLSAPIIWFLLNHYNLQALRNVATVEALIPISGPIPTLTIGWIAARLFKLGQPYDPNVLETERVGPDAYVARPPGGR